MKKYQSLVIYSGALSDTKLREEVAKANAVLSANGASEVQVENWGKRELAYRISKERFGSYISFNFQSDTPGVVEEFQRVLGIADAVLKFQTHNMSVRRRKVKVNPLRARQGGGFDDFSVGDDRGDLEY